MFNINIHLYNKIIIINILNNIYIYIIVYLEDYLMKNHS